MSALRRLNWPLLLAAVGLCGMGLLSLYTLSSPVNMANESITRAFLVKQAVFLGIALALAGVVVLPSYLNYRHVAYVLYGACLLTLAGLLVFGRYTRGARGWIPLGPVNLQPAEFMKIFAVLALARWISLSRDLQTLRGMLAPLVLAGAPALVILVQPDMGNAMLFLPVVLAMLYVGGARKRWLLAILLLVVVAVPVVYKYGMKDYQRYRLSSFLWPDKVPREFSYQQTQSVRAVAAGGLTGRGLGESQYAQPFYVPDRHTDFVFSLVGEDLGLAGSTLVIALFGTFFLLASRVALRTREPFGRLCVVGLTSFMALQVFVNIGMNTGTAPITGLTLPFVSYGGSSLLTCFLSLAIVLNVDARWVPTFSGRDLDRGHLQIGAFRPATDNWLRDAVGGRR